MKTVALNFVGGHALPHLLEVLPYDKEKKELIAVFDDGVEAGDTIITPANIAVNYTVESIIEKRKPKGDWSGKSYEGKKPTYYRLVVFPYQKQVDKK